jgi:hypothetical protein
MGDYWHPRCRGPKVTATTCLLMTGGVIGGVPTTIGKVC